MQKKYRDGLFRDYFSDKRRLLGLCNLLTGEDATDPDEITINTLDGIFFDEFKNDISCLFRGKFLVIIEHQSTLNENMPLRMLFYAADLLRQYVDAYKKKLYGGKLLPLPAPQCFVFYNGSKNESARRTMRLSDAFSEITFLELVVQFYNINTGKNDAFVAADEALSNYCTFVNRVKQSKAAGLDHNHAVAEAFDYCMAHGIMTEYLLIRKKELASMLSLEYDPVLAREAWHGIMTEYLLIRKKELASMLSLEYDPVLAREAWHEAGFEEGIEQGIDIGREQVAKNLLTMNLSIDYIVAATGLTAEQIRKLAETAD